MKINSRIIILTLLFCSLFPVFSQEEEEKPPEISSYQIRYLGDQMFSLSGGLFAPLFIMNPYGTGDNFIVPANLSLGVSGTLNYGAYVSPHWQLGMEVGMGFCYSPNGNMLSMVPLVFKAAYEWTPIPFLTIPLYLGTGVSFNTYLDSFRVDPLVKPGFGIFWNYSTEFSFGATAHYWWIPEFSSENTDHTRFGNFTDFRVVVEYHF